MKQEESKQAEAAFLEGEANFFLQEEPNGDNGQADLGYDEVDAGQSKNAQEIDGDEDEDAPEKLDQELEFDPERAQRMLNEMFGNRQLSEAEQRAKQAKYEKECLMGYFLQTISVQKLKQKIFFYDDLVKEMETEFKLRVREKRNVI